ncbi:MAG: PIN domain-containing protein [Geobacteraceae bacterium]|nr:PIN domain-containing protein [Geobacteraceae bacterium]
MSDIELDFGAITIDNCIFKGEGYKLDEGLLKQMVQFKNGPVQVIQTDIVHNEARKHLAENIGKARTSISQALRTAAKQLKIRQATIDAAAELLTIPGEDAEVAENRLLKYYERIGAEILKCSDYIDSERLIDMYFGTKAPFESVKDKKSEFPDAIALISLEKWAEEKGLKVIAVSNDGGWNNFSENSAVIKVVQSLSDAIALFLPHNKVNEIIAQIREDELLDEKNQVLEVIEREIINSLDGASIYVEACSNFYYEEDDVYATYVSHELVLDDKGLVDLKVVRIEDDIVVLQISANVTCEVTASFDFSVYDSIDRDHVGMGSNTCSTEETYNTDILISLTGDFTQGFDGLEVAEVEVLETIGSADFGEVEPDWGDHEE